MKTAFTNHPLELGSKWDTYRLPTLEQMLHSEDPEVMKLMFPEMTFLVGQMWYFCLVQVLLGHVFRTGS
jgi:hypothetical protein